MNELHLTAAEIKVKVVTLLQKVTSLENRFQDLKIENDILKIELQEQKNTIKALKDTNKMLRIAEILEEKNDTRELKKMISAHIKDIDECLRLLSNK